MQPRPTKDERKAYRVNTRDISYSSTNKRHITIDLTTPLGSGRCGDVYAGEIGGQPAAFKQILESSKERIDYQKMLREIDIMVELNNSPYIIKLFSYTLFKFQDSSQNIKHDCLIGMSFASGGTLDNHLESPLFTWSAQMNVIHGLAIAVDCMHQHDILHCDIKADNILVDLGDYSPKLIDFGESKRIGLDPNNRAAGSPIYSAPEVFVRLENTKQTDIFSACATINQIGWKLSTDSFMQMYCPNMTYDTFALEVYKGMRAPIAPKMPASLAALITWGFVTDPVKRPTSRELVLHTIMSPTNTP